MEGFNLLGREHLRVQPDRVVLSRDQVRHVNLGGLADERPRLIEGEVFGQHLEGIGHHRVRGQIDAGKQTLMHLVLVFFGERVGHVRADLNIELHNDSELWAGEAAGKGYLR